MAVEVMQQGCHCHCALQPYYKVRNSNCAYIAVPLTLILINTRVRERDGCEFGVERSGAILRSRVLDNKLPIELHKIPLLLSGHRVSNWVRIPTHTDSGGSKKGRNERERASGKFCKWKKTHSL